MIRKSIMLGIEEAHSLRREAFVSERSEAEIVREAVRRLLGLPIEAEGDPGAGGEAGGEE